MLKGRMPRRWPMMTREDSSVLELSIYSEGSSSSGDDDDDDDDLCSEWSEWEDPLWVKDDNLRRPAARGSMNKKVRRRAGGDAVSPRTGRPTSPMGLCTSSGNLAQQFIHKQLSSIVLQLPPQPASASITTNTKQSVDAKPTLAPESDAVPQSLSISISLSFDGQESGAITPIGSSSSSASSTSTPTASPSSRLRGRNTGGSAGSVTTSLMTAVVEECWSFEGSSSMLKSVSDLDEHIDNDDEGSIEEEEERDPCREEGSEDEDDDSGDDDVVEEKGIEYLLKKYFPDSPAVADEQPTPAKEEKEKKKKKEKKKEKKHGKKGEKKDKPKKKKKNKIKGKDANAPDEEKETSVAKEPTSARGLVFSVDHMILERRDKAREKYKSLFIPSLDLKRPAADGPGSDSDCDADTAGSSKSSPATTRRKGSQRIRKGERERRMPQSARESFGRKSARELGMILRCGSREDVTDDQCNIITAPSFASSATATPLSPRTNPHGSSSSVRIRSRTLSGQGSELNSARVGEEAQPSPRSKGKSSWIIKRENAPAREAPRGGSHIERGQVYGKLSVSTSSFLTSPSNIVQQRRPDASGEQSSTNSTGILSPRKKTGSLRSLLVGRRGSLGDALRRDAILSEESLASSSSSLSSLSSSASGTAVTIVSPSGLESLDVPSSASSSSSSPSMMRRGRSSSLNKAAGLFKRSGSVRTARDKKTTSDEAQSQAGSATTNSLASGDSRSSATAGDQQQQQREKLVGLKKSWREVKSYFASDREVRTYFNASASTPSTPKQPYSSS